MEAQLRLLSAPEPRYPEPRDEASGAVAAHDAVDDAPPLEPGPAIWRLSASTRAVGREGIESARSALRRARPANRSEATDGASRRSAA